MEMLRPMLILTLLAPLVYPQVDQAGFISLDCGVGEDYTDESSGLNYVTDTAFRRTGVPANITSGNTATLAQQFKTLRSFPNGTRNCYYVKPSALATSSKYLVRARFFYGNYDGLNALPKFDLYLGPNIWATVEFPDPDRLTKEIIVDVTLIYTSVCLVNTGNGTPFISALEFRPITASIYEPQFGSLVLFNRVDLGSLLTHDIRYQDDIFDRLWLPGTTGIGNTWSGMQCINTSLTVVNTNNDYQPPSIVMQTAVTPENVSSPIVYSFDSKDSTTEYYIYMHFAEVEILQPNQTREFTITLNGSRWYPSSVRPTYLRTNTLYSPGPQSGFDKFEFSFIRTENSTLPPIINAIEIYEAHGLFQKPTSKVEVDALKNIKTTNQAKRNWEGDPCAPQKYPWDGVNCTFSGYDPPKIAYLNLSSWGLTGEIPSSIANLQSLEILDLSNNNLSGSVPDFLTQLTSLTVLNLASNNLSGSIPVDLIKRSGGGSLLLSVDENLDLCTESVDLCTKEGENKKKSSNVFIPVVASIAAVIIFILLVALAIWFRRRNKNEGKDSKMTNDRYSNLEDQSTLEAKNRLVTYADVQRMTNNFKTIIGRGGFGTVYLGMLDGAQVAVKMLSPSSAQEFRAEVKILLMVHHRNLISLVGYFDDSNNKGLIYEYMVNGNLDDHLSERCPNVLKWKERLHIAVDSAQGLEYLHNGCKPQIVHRDVKTANILLNETFHAKISDFGLSRAFRTEGGTEVSTNVVGTPGYLDPEYNRPNMLSEKIDVYSFGVVLLKIISSRAVNTRNQETGDRSHISQWVSNILEREGDVRNVVDSRLHGDFDVNSAWKAVEVAMACVSDTSATRPTMTETLIELKDCLAMEMSRINSRGTISNNSIHLEPLNVDDSGFIPRPR